MAAPERVTLAAVQLEVDRETVTDGAAYAERIEAAVARASDARPDPATPALVVLPEYVGLFPMLAGTRDLLEDASSLEEALTGYVRANLLGVGWRRLRHRVGWARAVLLREQADLRSTYFELFPRLASEYDVTLVAGTGPFTQASLEAGCDGDVPGLAADAPSGAIYNAGVAFGPDGEPAGVYRKAELVEHEGPEGLDLAAGDPAGLPAVEIPVGTVGVAVCLDAFEPDPLATLEAAAVDVLVQPTANPIDWGERWQQVEWLEGTPDAVRDRSFTYGVNPMLVGTLLDLPFSGQSSVLASERVAFAARDSEPAVGYRDTDSRAEFVAVAEEWDEGAVVTATVPHPRLVSEAGAQ